MTDFEKRELLVVGAALVAVIVASAFARGSDSIAPPILVMWLAGAAALGLITGFTTGASETAGAGASLVSFVSAGVLVPILGGIAALLKQPEITKESSTYSGEHVTQKVTEVATQLHATEFHPLWVAGSFFVVFSLMAIVGIALGVRRRVGTINNTSAGVKLHHGS